MAIKPHELIDIVFLHSWPKIDIIITLIKLTFPLWAIRQNSSGKIKELEISLFEQLEENYRRGFKPVFF